jgi:hypothetical protein
MAEARRLAVGVSQSPGPERSAAPNRVQARETKYRAMKLRRELIVSS